MSDSANSASGQQLAASADALQLLSPQGLSLGIVVVSILLAIVTTIVVCLRVWVRTGMSGAFNRVWNTEDYLLVLSFVSITVIQPVLVLKGPRIDQAIPLLIASQVLFIPSVVFAVVAARYGVGTRDSGLPSPLYAIQAGKYTTYWEIFYFISSTIVKSAIGFTCVRIDRRRRITHPIMINISVMVVTAILALVFVFVNCKPFAATWNPAL